MKRSWLSIIVTLLISIAGFGQTAYRMSDAVLAAPRLLNYQGFLTDSSGNRYTGEANVKVSIHDSIVAGRTLWVEVINNVGIVQGIFNAILGNVTPIPDSVFRNAENRWLEISVGGSTFTPRTRITALPGAVEALWSKTAGYALAGSPDNDWAVGPAGLDSVLLTGNQLGISRGGASNALFDSYRCTHLNLGVACTTGTSGGNNTYITIAGGYRNSAVATAATVSGGSFNRSAGFASSVAGGSRNAAAGNYDVIAGGLADTANGPYGGILAGRRNVAGYNAGDTAEVVFAGLGNQTRYNDYMTIGNGQGNWSYGAGATILNGRGFTIEDQFFGDYSTGLNGDSSFVAGAQSVAGGLKDTTFGYHQAVLTGYRVKIGFKDWLGGLNGEYSTACCGSSIRAHGDYCFIGGGMLQTTEFNNDPPNFSTIGGGSDNAIYDDIYATVCGGRGVYYYDVTRFGTKLGGYRCKGGVHGAMGGGYENYSTGSFSAVVGGNGNQSPGGFNFTANNQSGSTTFANAASFNTQQPTAVGETHVGIIAKGSGAFSIDHPLDPDGKILNHYFAESPEMALMYRGIAKVSTAGWVEVRLPDYFDQLNRNPTVKLTGVGTSDVHLQEKISDNCFVISGPAGAEVHWLVFADRQDPSSDIIRILKPVEQDKDEALAGRSMDDNFLSSSLPQLEQMGESAGFEFRYPVNKKRYEDSKHDLEEAVKAGTDGQEGRQP